MADNELQQWAQSRNVNEDSPAPAGLQQSQQEDGYGAARQAGTAVSSFAQRWYGGGNSGGTANGYNTAFNEKFFSQQNEAVEQGNINRFFDREDVTGVVTYDHTSSRGNLKFGDVFVDGEKRGNLYDVYGKDEADLMMADYTLDAESKAQAFDRGETAQFVQRKREETEAEHQGWLSQQDFQGDVDERVDDLTAGAGDEAIGIGTGAAGGAATGAGIGGVIGAFFGGIGAAPGAAIGAAIGGVVGGIGGWLNRDELTQTVAAAAEKTERANEEHGALAAAAQVAQGVGAVGQKALQPTTNLVKGSWDAAQGTVGDGVTEYYEMTQEGDFERPGWMQALTVGTSLIDSMGYISGAGGVAFAGSMTASITGALGELTFTGGERFNDRSGQFESVLFHEDAEGNREGFAPGKAAAALGVIGIDAVQMFGARGLGSSMLGSQKAIALGTGEEIPRSFGERVVAQIAPRTTVGRAAAKGETVVAEGGYVYTVNAAGQATSRKMTMGILAPSELIQAVNTGLRARMAAESAKDVVNLTADDFYRAANELATGVPAIRTILTNGFGEATEEGIQAVLEPLQFGDKLPGLTEVADAALQGFAMGAGMGAASRIGSGGTSRRMYAEYALGQVNRGQDFQSYEEWNQLDDFAKRESVVLSQAERGVGESAAKLVNRSMRQTVYGTVPEFKKAEKAALTAQAMANGSINDSLDAAFVIAQHEDAATSSHVAGMTVKGLGRMLQGFSDGIADQIASIQAKPEAERDMELLEHLELTQEQHAVVARVMRDYDTAVDMIVDSLDNEADVRFTYGDLQDMVGEINDFLRAAYEMQPDQPAMDPETGQLLDGVTMTEAQLRARRHAVTLLNAREPIAQQGSFLALMPQITTELVRGHGHNGIQLGHAVLQSIGGDYDGDKIHMLAQVQLDLPTWEAIYAGDHLYTADGKANIGARDYEKDFARYLGEGLIDTSVLGSKARGALETIQKTLESVIELRPHALDDQMQVFERMVKSADEEAAVSLQNAILAEYGDQVRAAGRRLGRPIPLEIDRIIQAEYQKYQTERARQAGNKTEYRTKLVTTIPQGSDYARTISQKAATDGQTAGIVVAGVDMFRIFQHLKYVMSQSTTIGSLAEADPVLVELQEKYAALSRAATESKLDALYAKDEITNYALNLIRRLALAGDAVGTSNMAVIGNMQVPNFSMDGTWHGDEPGQARQISLTQWALREALQWDRANKGTAWDNLPAVQARHARLRGLLTSQDDKSAGYESKSAQAFVEVFSAVPLGELVGEAANHLAGRSVGQFVNIYSTSGEQNRRTMSKVLKDNPAMGNRRNKENPPYTEAEIKAGEITPLNSVLTAMIETGNKRIALDKNYNAIGDIADRSNRTHTELLDALASVRDAFAQYVGTRSISRKNIGDIQRVMTENPGWAESLLELIPDAITNGVMTPTRDRNGRTRLMVAPWVYEMLTMEPEQGAMHYWRSLKLTALNSKVSSKKDTEELQYSDLDDRILQLMYRLSRDPDPQQYLAFQEEMLTATSLTEFMQLVNRKYIGDEAPYTAWVSDVSDFSPNKAQGGWSSASDGAANREAISDFKRQSARLVESIKEETQEIEADDAQVALLKRGREVLRAAGGMRLMQAPNGQNVEVVPDSIANDAEVREYVQWTKLVDRARERISVLGPNAIQDEALGSLLGFYAPGADKGQVPEQLQALGQYAMLKAEVGFNIPFSQHTEKLTASKLSSLGTNIHQIFDGGRTVLEDGTIVKWDPITADTLLDRFGQSRSLRAAVKNLVLPTVWDRTPDGKLAEQYLTQGTLAESMRFDIDKQIQEKSNRGRRLYLSELSAETAKRGDDYAVMTQLNEQVIAHSTAKTSTYTFSQAESDVNQEQADLVEVLSYAAELNAAGHDMKLVWDSVLATVEGRNTNESVDERKVAEDFARKVAERTVNERLADLQDQMTAEAGKATVNPQRIQEIQNQIDRVKAANATQLTARTNMERIVSRYGYVTKGKDGKALPEATLNARRHQLMMEADLIGPGLATRVPAVMMVNSIIRDHMKKDPTGSSIPLMPDSSWDLLSRSMITYQLDQQAETMSGATELAPFPSAKVDQRQRKYYDQSYSYLLDMLDPESVLLQSATALRLRQGAGAEKTDKTIDGLVRLLGRTIYSPEKFGPWTSAVPKALVESNPRMSSSPTEVATQAAGLETPRQLTFSTATEATTLEPPAELVSTLKMDLGQLRGASDIPGMVKVLQDDGTVADVLRGINPLELNGRFASGLTVSYRNRQGATITVDLWAGRPSDPGNPESLMRESNVGRTHAGVFREVTASPYRMISQRQLEAAMYDALPLDAQGELPADIDPASVSIELQYLHPDSQPATEDFYHNIYFEGQSNELNAQMQKSLNAEFWFSASGAAQDALNHALSSGKKGEVAYLSKNVPTGKTVAEMEMQWSTDLSAVIRRKAMHLLTVDPGGSGTPDPIQYNAVAKKQKAQHFVRGINSDGNPELWDAEHVIAHQMKHPGDGLPLQDPELVVLSEDALNTLYGEKGVHGVAPLGDLKVARDTTDVKPWRGLTEDALKRLPGLLEMRDGAFVTKDIFDTDLVYRRGRVSHNISNPMLLAKEREYERGLDRMRARKSKEHAARMESRSFERNRNDRLNAGFDQAMAGFDKMRAVFDYRRAGLDTVPLTGEGYADLAQQAAAELEAAITPDSNDNWFSYVFGGENTPATGTLTELNIEASDKDYIGVQAGETPVLGDKVNIVIDSFGRNGRSLEEQMKHATRALDYFMSTGAHIVLVSGDGSRDLATFMEDHLLKNEQYKRAGAARHVFSPRFERTRAQTARAIDAQMAETHAISARSRISMLYAEGFTSAENSAYFFDPVNDQVSMKTDLMPTEPYENISTPTLSDDVRAVKRTIETLSTQPARIKQIAEQAGYKGKQIAELEAALQAAAADYAAAPEFAMARPAPGQWLRIGTVIPYFDASTGDLVLYRHGHDAPKPYEIRQRIKEQRDAGRKPAIVVYGAKPMGGAATVREGMIEEYQDISQYGQMGFLRMPLQGIFGKLVGERTAFKIVGSTKPAHFKRPDGDLVSGWGLNAIGDIHSPWSKESWDDVIFNHRNAIAFLGMDFTEALSKTLMPSAGWDSMDAAARKAHTAELEDMLTRATRDAAIPESQAKALMEDNVTAKAMADDVWDVSNADAFGLDKGWVDRAFAEDRGPEAEITRLLLLTLMTPGTRVSSVIRSGGFGSPDARSGQTQSIRMKRLLTDALDNTPNPEVRDWLFTRYNQSIGENYAMDHTFRVYAINDDPGETVSGWLAFPEVHHADNNPVTDALADRRKQKADHSIATAAIVREALGGELVYSKGAKAFDGYWGQQRVTDFKDGRDASKLFNAFSSKEDSSFTPWKAPTMSKLLYMKMGRKKNAGYHKAVEMEGMGWDEDNAEKATFRRDQALERRDRVARDLGLLPSDYVTVDYLVRYLNGQPLDDKGGHMTAAEFNEGLNLLEQNIEAGRLPTYGGAVPRLDYHLLTLLFKAKLAGRGRFQLRTTTEPDSPTAEGWDDWLAVALGESHIGDKDFHPMFILDYDAVTHTYMDAEESLSGMPVSRDDLINQELLDPANDELVISMNPDVNLQMEERVYLEHRVSSLEERLGAEFVNGELRAKAPADGRGHHRAAAWKAWGKRHGVMPTSNTTVVDLKQRGIQVVDTKTRANTAMHIAMNLRAGMALWNPGLWVSAIGEMTVRQALDTMTSTLMGTSTSVGGKFLSTTPAAEVRELTTVIKSLGSNDEFLSMAYSQTMFQQRRNPNAGVAERATGWLAQTGARMQDPMWRMRGDVMARRYVESVLEYTNTLPTSNVVSVKMLAAKLKTDPHWVENNIPAAHSMALRSIENTRSLKATPLSKALQGFYEPLTQNPSGWVAMGSTLFLKLPMMFSTYGSNVLTTITGMQGPMAALAMTLHRRKNPFGRWASFASASPMTEEQGYFDMTDVMDSVDLSKAVIQGGITQTTIMAMAMMAGGLGLSGEDDEDKRRRRAAEYQGAGYVYDPRKIENDFRNADAIFLDKIPLVSAMFQVPDGEGGTRSMATPHWMLRQFISPVIGMERFWETGDYRQIMWGYQDALGAFPLINSSAWEQSLKAYDQLTANAEDASKRGTPEDLADASYYLLSTVAAFESMLFENSFVNTIYTAMDKYDRDPWVLPQTDAEGNIVRDELSQPQETDALQTYLDEDGQPAQGYVSRDWMDAQIHGLAENRASLALFMSLFTGATGRPNDYLRGNMAVKERKIDLQEIGQEEAKGLILSVYDAEGGEEVLTKDGARAVFQGIWKRSVQLGDASLDGIYIPYEMRKEIQADLVKELYTEAIGLGMSESQANEYVDEVYYGSDTNPWATPLREIVWSDQISGQPQARYQQLNTTYVMGPDGRPWATGVKRGDLLTAFGQATGLPVPGGALQGYYQGDVGNLDVDSRLNSVDDVAGINTGLRALNRVDDSWDIPTDEELAKDITDAIEDAAKEIAASGGYGAGGYGGGGGYRRSGGGGGSYTRMNAPVRSNVPYINETPYMNANSPYVRRSSIRRERFSSQRGRLNQWQ